MLTLSGSTLPPKSRRSSGVADLQGHFKDATVAALAIFIVTKKYKWVVGPSVRKRKKFTEAGSVTCGLHSEAIDIWDAGNIPDGSPAPGEDQENTANIHPLALTHSFLSRSSIPSFDLESSEYRRQNYYLDHYFNHIANYISIAEGADNPLGEQLRQHFTRSNALTNIVVAIAAMHMANRNSDKCAESSAWHYRTQALRMLQKDIQWQSNSIEVLTSVLLLGATESWFDTKNSCSMHLDAARQLILHNISSGLYIPPFFAHWLCWIETLASFVSDDEGLVFSSPLTYTSLTAYATPMRGNDSNAVIDPFLGTWTTLMPLVGRVGGIVRRLRRNKDQLLESDDFSNLIHTAETDLLEWEHPQPQPSLGAAKLRHFYSIAEAYRLSALLTLYNYSRDLLYKRVGLIDEVVTASEFLSQLAYSAIVLLRQIPVDSRLWNVCAIPILSAGQLIPESPDRDFLRSVMNTLAHKTQQAAVAEVGKLLEDVWRRRDAGNEVWWMDLLEETGHPMLVN
ncbi:hypothetical protein JX266_012253 [Neoarthrinium moseri]|nr:hypothetical protein JX266_012253 [Neoarthrinium moseri]